MPNKVDRTYYREQLKFWTDARDKIEQRIARSQPAIDPGDLQLHQHATKAVQTYVELLLTEPDNGVLS